MEFEVNGMLYHDPNAYIQTQIKNDKKQTKKIVFQEPYENLPNHYINNNFKKQDCDCVPKSDKPKHNEKEEKCNCETNSNSPFGNFNLKSLLPLLSSFGGGKGELNNIISMLGSLNQNSDKSNSGFDFSKIISMLSNSGGLNLLNLFNKKPQKKEKTMKSTDFQIKDYVRVD